TLVSKLTQGNQAGVSEWIPFGAGYSLGTLLSHLASAQMETTEIRIMRSQTLDFLDEFLTHIFSDDTSRSNVTMSSIDTNLGIMIGLSKFNREVEEKVESIYQRAISDIEEFVKKEGNVNSRIRKKIVGSCWLAGFSKGEIREEVVEILKKATKISGEKREWNGYYFHFSQAYSHALQEILLAKPSSHYMVSYSSQINAQIDMLKSREAIQRHIAILTLGSLTGINYFERILSTHNESYYFFSLASDTTTALVLDNLQSISIISGMNVKDVKGGRIALAVLGRIVQYASRLSDEFTSTFTTSSMEPKDYSRLPVQSYLKALFNWLTKMSKAKKLGSPMNVEAVSLIISTISKVKVGLPPVNWFPLLSRFGDPAYKRCNLHYKSILMAIQHCQQSTSLMEFLIYSLVRFPEIHKSLDNDIEFEKLLVGNAMGKILELCGFENTLFDNENGTSKKDTEINKTRGMESVLKSVTIPSSRVTEIVDCVLNSLFGETKDRETPKDIELQTIFLTTIVGHISRINSTGGSTLLQDIRKLLKEKYYVLHPPSDEEQAQIIRLFVHSCIINIEDHHTSPDLLKEAIILCTMSELGRIDPIKHLIPFLSERLINVDIMSLELSSVSNLIFSWIFRSINVHIHSSAKSEINKRRNRLEWLARILELLLILGTQRQGERVNLADDKEIFEYGMNVALCGLVNLSWDENLAKITTREKSYTCEYYEMWNKEFERIVQDKASVRKLSTLIPREALIQSRESEQIDAIVKKVRKAFSYFEVVKRLLRLLELVPTTPNYVEYRFAIRSTLTSLRPHITTQEYLDIVSSQS
ncbi:15794_t:CDS:2, partial [Acaulospora morrowiae]